MSVGNLLHKAASRHIMASLGFVGTSVGICEIQATQIPTKAATWP
jgi:hypothetical protein